MSWSTESTRVNGDIVTAAIWNQAVGDNSDDLFKEACKVSSETINPYFDVWQRNTTFTPAAATNTFTADRWRVNIGTGGVATISRQANTAGAPLGAGEEETPFCFRWNQTTGGTGSLLLTQPHESARTRAGETVTVILIAKVSSGTLSVTPKVVQKFGSGGAPSADVTVTGSAHTVTTTYQKFTQQIAVASVSGKTFGTTVDTDSLDLQLSLPVSTTFTLDIGLFCIVPGTAGSIVVGRRRFDDELRRCQRTHWKSFPYATAEAQNAGNTGCLVATSAGTSTGHLTTSPRFTVAMRAAPTVTTYNPSAANANWRSTGGADITVLVENVGDGGFTLTSSGACLDSTLHRIQASADAELNP